MKRLVKAITNGDLKDLEIEVSPNDAEDLIKLKTLDSTEVKTGTCPECEYSPLDNQEGYKICKNCGTAYKILKEDVFLVK